jgi:hypothetical protein
MQSLSLILYFLISAMSEFEDQLVEAAEKGKVSKLQVVTELRELAAFKGQSGDASICADASAIREKIAKTQTGSLGLFQKVSGLLPVESRLTLMPLRSMRSALLRIWSLSNLHLNLNHPRKRRKTKQY